MFERQVDDDVVQKLITVFSIIVRERRIDRSEQNLTPPFRFPTPPYRTGFDDALNYLIQNQAENCDLESLSIHSGATCFLSATTSGKSLPIAASRDIDCRGGSR
jgi:hypothetical protein